MNGQNTAIPKVKLDVSSLDSPCWVIVLLFEAPHLQFQTEALKAAVFTMWEILELFQEVLLTASSVCAKRKTNRAFC